LPEGHKVATDDEVAQIHQVMEDYKTTKAKQIQEQCNEDAKGLMRDFCVMVLD